ncbi:MAG: tyrosine-type recombinase/integrase [Lachnospiraceae bacterium]|nr:tyrosine-type recombinase/integrase [Lachnospiraceae bacterium]
MYSLAIQFDFHVVMRIGELLALRFEDIEGDYIHIQAQRLTDFTMNDDLSFQPREYVNANHIKGHTNDGFRYQPLTPKAKEILEKVKEKNPNGKYIFMTDGHQLTADTFNDRLHRYCRKAGVKGRSSHKIRFTVASTL